MSLRASVGLSNSPYRPSAPAAPLHSRALSNPMSLRASVGLSIRPNRPTPLLI
jgi:hypothetical protein